MHEFEEHQMIWQKIYPSGIEEWFCPTCGRCLLVTRKPKFMEIIREPGDEYAFHIGGKDSLSGGPLEVISTEDIDSQAAADGFEEEKWLAPWLGWMQAVDFDRLWEA